MNEFELINKYFDWGMGIGDDCALINADAYQQLVTTVDTLIEGVHFPVNTAPADIAYKALAVNLSDLAAMGATPYYFTLALTLPSINEQWLNDFSLSLKALATKYDIQLVGGDTTKGTLSISINATGVVKKQALLRSNAQVGDAIFVSNTLGDAALAWQQIQAQQTPTPALLKQFNRPKPQIKLGQSLLGIANSCIDISDGLQQDLSHILAHSKVGAVINIEALPLYNEVAQYITDTGDWCVALAGGDDYELCFTVPQAQLNTIQSIEKKLGIVLTKIGVITDKQGLEIKGLEGDCQSYRHF
ncbi:MAG: Thiamine-monophosphate kinase [Catillopecten margaritatus gill symbiont]|uniref:Thiamine-monophosphate kinase n=1 Tax=Catillopecten margaritatus gill symbiont TaxID=3083288 RepID=A0AAU6PII1_9GAMM